METRPDHRDSKTVQIALAYDNSDDVESIASSLLGRPEAGLPRRSPLAEQTPLILAGGISSQLLAAGLVKWLRGLKGISIYVGIRWGSNKFEIDKRHTPGASEIRIVHRDGREDRRPEAEPTGTVQQA
jgi:hypothetical protein